MQSLLWLKLIWVPSCGGYQPLEAPAYQLQWTADFAAATKLSICCSFYVEHKRRKTFPTKPSGTYSQPSHLGQKKTDVFSPTQCPSRKKKLNTAPSAAGLKPGSPVREASVSTISAYMYSLMVHKSQQNLEDARSSKNIHETKQSEI